MRAKTILTVSLGKRRLRELVFEKRTRCVIGRAEDCDLQVPTDLVHADISRHHCLLEIDPPAMRVRDLGSLNGTYVNGEKIGQRGTRRPNDRFDPEECPARELHEGDEVRVGSMVFRVAVAEPATSGG